MPILIVCHQKLVSSSLRDRCYTSIGLYSFDNWLLSPYVLTVTRYAPSHGSKCFKKIVFFLTCPELVSSRIALPEIVLPLLVALSTLVFPSILFLRFCVRLGPFLGSFRQQNFSLDLCTRHLNHRTSAPFSPLSQEPRPQSFVCFNMFSGRCYNSPFLDGFDNW